MSNRGPYRIQTVSELTGIPSATLRAWERRYGVPAPMRTASSYRLYSEQDVELVTKLRDLCANEGMAPAEAARLLKETGVEHPEADVIDADPFTVARDRLVSAVSRFDPDALEDELRYALCLGSAVAVFERVLGPALVEIGEGWHAGTLSVAQEHLASEQIGGAVRDLLRLVQPVGAGRMAVLACFADEEHVVPLHGIGFRFAMWGFRVVLLGARTPPSALADAVAALGPDVVGLSVTTAPLRPRAKELVTGYQQACGDTPWVVGGLGSDAMRALIEAAGGAVAEDDMTALQSLIERKVAARRGASRG